MAENNVILIAKLDELSRQFDEAERQLSDPAIASDHDKVRLLAMKRAALEHPVRRYRRWQQIDHQIAEHEQIEADVADQQLAELARAELPDLRQQAQQLLAEASESLVTADDRSVAAVIVELRAGTGGSEAALWAGDLVCTE